ncbi:four helix bundle protein [Patescibacteria group bacterium]|nr:four helix bundle protein [Patescibacteria group bacterium]MDE1944268.1 four helix bundle protein [Patescibacteria group bacterium]MDE1944655.1 four helix bundle protein [Patescibacteria group bacterium]
MTLKQSHAPEGYKQLLAYQKAERLQEACAAFTSRFSHFSHSPHFRTLMALADQMDRSARSVKQNIVEGWKRNSTKEYYDFLGFSIGANAELQEDCDDIIKGRYEMGGKGLKREEWEEGEKWDIERVEKLPFYPLDSHLPLLIQLRLRCKELNFLLDKLQKSLAEKMREDHTLSGADRFNAARRAQAEEDKWFAKSLEEQGLTRLSNGQVVTKGEKGNKGEKGSVRLSLFLLFSPFLLFSFLLLPAPAEAALTRPPNNLGLVGYWPFDEGSGSTAYDRSGFGNNGTLVNSPAWTVGKLGGALSFNGTNQYTTTGTTSFPTGSSARSVFAWIYVAGSTGNEQDVFSYGNGGTTVQASNFGMQASGLKLFFSSWGSGSATFNSSLSVTTGTWHFVGYTLTSSGTATLYLDGTSAQATGMSVGTVIPAVSDASVIGSGPNGQESGRYFDGKIDDVRIYNRALSAADVARLYQLGTAVAGPTKITSPTTFLTNGLVGYWTFDGKNMVNNVADSSGNGNNGSLVGFTSTTTAETLGKIGQALNFNGTNQYVLVPDAPSIRLSNKFSISFWFKTANLAQTNTYIMSRNNSTGGTQSSIIFGFVPSTIEFYASGFSGSDPRTGSQISISDTRWHQVTYTYDGTTWSGYRDGQQIFSTSRTFSLSTASLDGWYIGSANTFANFIKASLDDVRIYNRALSASEVQELYNATGGAPTITPAAVAAAGPAPGNLVGYWTFNNKDMNWQTGIALDKSGQGNNGTLINMSTTTSPVEGKVGQALKFNGTSQYVKVSNGTIVKTLPNSSISAWIKVAGTVGSTAQTIYSENEPLGVDYGLLVEGSGNNGCGASTAGRASFYMANGSDHNACTTTRVDDGKWHYLVATYSGGSAMNIYLDGVLSGSGTGSAAASAAASYVGRSGQGVYFNGTIDDVRIYNTALTAAQVLQLYNATK